ncbi:hypothetical protein B0H17DRAFT_1200924 [Mycena rosella]|uniref:Uncharacterized protein n=1 Tax=Mycena rosella TaxID=1033263 RepID=A0AAD7DHM8_MYCRO|nr:hypothetical protein B0H17DRAFT_1200924 [Mycena rosella]
MKFVPVSEDILQFSELFERKLDAIRRHIEQMPGEKAKSIAGDPVGRSSRDRRDNVSSRIAQRLRSRTRFPKHACSGGIASLICDTEKAVSSNRDAAVELAMHASCVTECAVDLDPSSYLPAAAPSRISYFPRETPPAPAPCVSARHINTAVDVHTTSGRVGVLLSAVERLESLWTIICADIPISLKGTAARTDVRNSPPAAPSRRGAKAQAAQDNDAPPSPLAHLKPPQLPSVFTYSHPLRAGPSADTHA